MNKEKPSYYAIISAEVRYDKRLKPNVKLIYAEITALCNMNLQCFASNKYFSELYGVGKGTISGWISELVRFGYIKTDYKYKEGTKEIEKRYITIVSGGVLEKKHTVLDKNDKSNTTRNNTTSLKTFKKPMIHQIKFYCDERNNQIDPEAFYDFYESKGWKVGTTKMKDWKACIRTWEKRKFDTRKLNLSHAQKKSASKLDQQISEWEKAKGML